MAPHRPANRLGQKVGRTYHLRRKCYLKYRWGTGVSDTDFDDCPCLHRPGARVLMVARAPAGSAAVRLRRSTQPSRCGPGPAAALGRPAAGGQAGVLDAVLEDLNPVVARGARLPLLLLIETLPVRSMSAPLNPETGTTSAGEPDSLGSDRRGWCAIAGLAPPAFAVASRTRGFSWAPSVSPSLPAERPLARGAVYSETSRGSPR